jgi:hypothetical protein
MNATKGQPRFPERIAAGHGYARCHRPPGHPGPCHAASRSWWPTGDLGQRLRLAVPCFTDCLAHARPATAAAGTEQTHPAGAPRMEMIDMIGKKSCGHTGRAPWGTVKCSKTPGHRGQHGARGLRWGSDGKVKLGVGKGKR